MRAHCKDVDVQQESVAFAGKGRAGQGRAGQGSTAWWTERGSSGGEVRWVASANRNS